MAGLAVCLLWLTSLAVARSIVNGMIRSPPLPSVTTSIERALNATIDERDRYAECAQRRAGECNQTFNLDLQAEVDRCNVQLQLNRARLDNYTEARLECSEHFGEVILSVDYLVKVKNAVLEPTFTLVANLSQSAQCVNVKKILADQIAAINALKKAEEFQATTDDQVTVAHSQYRARLNYDLEYTANATVGLLLGGDALNQMVSDPETFFRNMSQSQDQMLACSTASGTYGNATCQGLSLMQQVNNLREQLRLSYQTQANAATSTVNSLVEDFGPFRTFYNTFKALVDRYAPIKAGLDGAANDNGGSGGGLGAFGYQDVNLAFPPFVLQSVDSFTSQMDTTATANGISTANINRFLGQNEATEGTMETDAQRTKDGQKAWQAGFFADYNPPPYDVDQAQSDWEKTNSAYLNEVQSDLSAVSRRVEPEKKEEFKPSSNSSESGRRAIEILQDYNVTGFEPYAYGNIDPDFMVMQWFEITNLALALDYLYRTLHSIAIIRSYWRVSAVLAPPADVRVGNVKKGVAVQVRRNPDQAMAYLLTHPAVNLLIAIIFLGLISSIFLTLYNPIFNAYVSGCPLRESNYTVEDRKTFITDNTFQVALQYANRDGDIFTSTEIDRINVARELECTKNEDLVFRQQRLFRQELDFNIEKWNELLENVNSFRACINASKIDEIYTSQLAINATNGTSTSVFGSLFHPTCTQTLPILSNKEFDCAAIQRCDPTCSGANNGTVGRTTWDAGCTTEYYLHSSVLGTAFAALAFILMNLSRWTFLRGLRRALMSHFAIGEYSYLATTDEHGNIEYPEKVTQGELSMKEMIRDELHKTIKSYERSGIYICVFALLLNVPWVIGLIKFSENLTFQANNNA